MNEYNIFEIIQKGRSQHVHNFYNIFKEFPTFNDKGETPITHAIKLGKLSILDALLCTGCDANINNQKNELPLLLAWHDKEMVEMLLKYGATPTTFSLKGCDIFSLALEPRNIEQLPVEEVDTINNDWSLLMLASHKRWFNTAKILINKGANMNFQGRHGKTALIVAVEAIVNPLVELLLIKGANLELSDNQGNTALLYAAKNDFSLYIVKLLYKYGCSMTVTNCNNQCAKTIAELNQNTEIVKFLDTV